jgi:hypothetical protein
MNLQETVAGVYDFNSGKRLFYEMIHSSFSSMYIKSYIFVAERVSNVVDRRVANRVDDVVLSEFPFSSSERLLVTESILKELE